jgi:hypothetical protein
MRGLIWLVLAGLLFLAWVGMNILYRVGFLIHLLLIFALAFVVVHLFSGKRPG